MARKRRAVFAVAALSGLLVLAGCVASTRGPDSGGASTEPSIGPVPHLVDSAGLRLPVEDYLPTAEQNDRLGAANLVLIQRCMARFGFTYAVSPMRGSDYGPVSLTERRYGITDTRLAQTDGYGLGARDPARQAKPKRPDIGPDGENVLSGSGRSIINGQPVPDGGCIGEADRALNQPSPAGADVRKGNALQLASFEASKADSRVQAAFAAWSACMNESGYHYADPLAAAGDPAFTTPASAGQIAVALADIACKTRTNLVGIWFTVDVAYERRAIDVERAAFEKVKAMIAARDQAAISAIK